MRVLVALALLLGFAAPARAADPSIEDGSAQAALDGARARFAAAGLSDYGFTVRRSCFCPSSGITYVVHVRDGRAVGAPAAIEPLDTVPKLFALVQSAIDSRDDQLGVHYDELGLPTSITVDARQYAFDDEFGVTASGLAAEDPALPRDVADSIEDGTAANRLSQRRRTWAQAQISSYRWKVRRLCFCPRQFTRQYAITVRDGRTKGVPKPIRPFRTVTRLFKLIDTAIARRSSGLKVKYAGNGRPLAIALDPSNLSTDDEQSIITRAFKPLR